MSTLKVLVTGSNGLLGQKIVYKLKDNLEVELIATGRGENRLINKSGYTYTEMDISDSVSVDEVVGKYQPDCIIHCAAQTNVDYCELNQEECRKANINGVKNIVAACNKYNIQLVHVSTDFVFDGEAGPYKEDDKPNPVSYYGWSKWEGEKLVQASGLDWAILRTILVFGITDNMSRSNFALWAKRELEQGNTIRVVNDQFRAPTLAEDLADACIAAALKKAKGIYHISSEFTYSVLQLVEKVADFYSLDKSLIQPISSKALSQPAKRPPRTGFIIDKAKRDLGFKPTKFEDALKILDSQLKR